MAKSAQQMADNWAAAMGSSQTQQKYRDGIKSFTGNPMELAASDQAMQAYQDGVSRSVSSGKRKNALQRSDRNVWSNNAQTIGASALSTGATKAKPKMSSHFQRWAPIYEQARSAAAALPKSDWQGRFAAAVNVLIANKGK